MRTINSGAEELISHHTFGKSGFIKRTGYASLSFAKTLKSN